MRIDRSEEVATPRHSIPSPPPLPFLLTFDSITHRVGFRRADALYPRSIAVEIETSLLERCAENSPTIGMLRCIHEYGRLDRFFSRRWRSSNFASPETRIRRGKGGGCLADDCVYRFDHDVM